MKSWQQYFLEYENSHKSFGNRITHLIGIPLIIFGLFGLLDRIELVNFQFSLFLFWIHGSAALFLWILSTAFYFKLNVLIGLQMLVTTGTLLLLSTLFPATILWFSFVFGWAIQFIGHHFFEKKKPAFLENFIHLLIGPAFLQIKYLGFQPKNKA